MKLSVLMPAYNERRTIREIVQRVMAQKIPGVNEMEIIIVDDGSTDGSGEVIQELAELIS